jgi:hypothetical protein
MSSKLSNFVFSIDDKHLKPGPRLVLKSLCWHFNDSDDNKYGLCCPTQETIAKETGYERTHIGKVTSKLEAMGRVVVTPMPGWVHRYSYDVFFTVGELVRLGLPEEYVLGRIKELVERESEDTAGVKVCTADLPKRLEAKRIISPLSLPPDPCHYGRGVSENGESRLSGSPTLECLLCRQWNVRFVDIRNVGKADNELSANATLTVNREQETGEQKEERQTGTGRSQSEGRSTSSLSTNTVKTPVSEWADKVLDLIESGKRGRRQAREKLLPLQSSDRERIDQALTSPSFVFMLKQKKYPVGYLISLLSEGFDETLDKMLEHDSRRSKTPPKPAVPPVRESQPDRLEFLSDPDEEDLAAVPDEKGINLITTPPFKPTPVKAKPLTPINPAGLPKPMRQPVRTCGVCGGTGTDSSFGFECLCVTLGRNPDFPEHMMHASRLGVLKCRKCGGKRTFGEDGFAECPACHDPSSASYRQEVASKSGAAK